MNARTPLLVALLALPLSAQAGDSIKQLAEYAGMSERKVQMVIGPRTAFPEYRASYQRAAAQFRVAVGDENFRRAMKGESFVIELPPVPDEHARVAVDKTSAEPQAGTAHEARASDT